MERGEVGMGTGPELGSFNQNILVVHDNPERKEQGGKRGTHKCESLHLSYAELSLLLILSNLILIAIQ